jgi:hypothetical protein
MEDKTPVQKKSLPQSGLAAINAFSLIYAVEAGLYAVVFGIIALTQGRVGAGTAYPTLLIGISALVFGLLAFLTMKKITDKEAVKKAYGVAAVVLLIQTVLLASLTVGTALYALFSVGVGSIQGGLWLNGFLPLLGATVVSAGLLVAAKKAYDGLASKILPIMIYVALGVAGLGILLATIATFVGWYGSGGSSVYDNIPSYYDSLYD